DPVEAHGDRRARGTRRRLAGRVGRALIEAEGSGCPAPVAPTAAGGAGGSSRPGGGVAAAGGDAAPAGDEGGRDEGDQEKEEAEAHPPRIGGGSAGRKWPCVTSAPALD